MKVFWKTAGGSLSSVRYVVDGTTEQGELYGGARRGPYRIFDIAEQDWLPGVWHWRFLARGMARKLNMEARP